MRITVLGAGNGGQAFAGGLTLKGHTVHLAAVPEHDTQIKILSTFGGVLVESSEAIGIAGGFARIDRIDTDVAGSLATAELVLLVVPAYAQETYFGLIAEHAPDGLLVVMQPGKFGSLRLAQRLREAGRDPHALLIAETASFLYAAKIHGMDHIWLRGLKAELELAALPAGRTGEVIERLAEVHTQYVPARNVLATSMDDAAYALHPVTTLLNLARLEKMGPYRTASYDITEQTGRMVEAVDNERCAVAAAFGLQPQPLLEQMASAYGLTGATVYEGLSKSTVHRDQMTPRNARHRYVSEEVPFGLVPLQQFGQLAGVPTPAIDSIVSLASIVNDEDYTATGRHLDGLGLAGLSVDEVADLL